MGFMTSPPALADIDGDGDVDGTLRRIKQGTGISLTLSNNILTIANTGSGVSKNAEMVVLWGVCQSGDFGV